jgi:outer membrane protein assembly factor BamB
MKGPLVVRRDKCEPGRDLQSPVRQSVEIVTLVFLGVLSLLAGTSGATEDGLIASPEPGWPQWRGPRRDGISDEKGLLARWPQDGPKRLWAVEGLGKGWSSPIIVRDRLYITGDVGEDLVIFAFALDGTPIWRTTNGPYWKNPYPGGRACCAFSEGRLYNMNAHGRVACLDAASGKELWAVNVLERFKGKNITWAMSECLLVDGPRVIVTPGGKRALMAALDKQTGQTVWTTPPLGDDVVSHCSPILLRYAGHRQIVNCSSAHGFGVDADTGKLLWAVPVTNRYGTNVSTPLYDSGRVFFMTPYDSLGRQYRLTRNGTGVDAELTWKTFVDAVTGCAVLADGTLYAACYDKTKWWFGIDWDTGATKYEMKDFTTGAAIYADGLLYILDEQGNAGLVKPAAEGLEIVGCFRLTSERVRDAWAHPVLLDGRLYLRYHDALSCYDVRQP